MTETKRNTRQRPPRRRPFFLLATIFLGLLHAGIVVEVVIRVLHLAPPESVSTVTEAQFNEIPGLLRPGQDLIDHQKPALPHRVRVNRQGLRGHEIPPERPDREYRILAVGDSFTFGDFVNDEETLPALLEEALGKTPLGTGCDAVRVMNAGVGGTTIATHAEMVRRGQALEPDLVLLTFSENDVRDLRNPMWDRLAKNRRMKSRFPLSIVYPTLRHTATWNFLLKVRARRIAHRAAALRAEAAAASELNSHRSPTDPRIIRDRERYRTMLAELHAELTVSDIPLLFAVYPGDNAIAGEDAREQIRWAEAMARQEGVATLGLIGPLLESGLTDRELYLLPHDGHPSPTGYRISAAALAEQIAAIARESSRCSGD